MTTEHVLSAAAGAGFIVVGITRLVGPRRSWYVTQGWWSYDNAQHVRLSDAYRFWNGIGAVSIILAGFFMLLHPLLEASR